MKLKDINHYNRINMAHLTMQELEDLGFKVVKSYTHDEYMTQRRKKGVITVETTWKKTGEFESQELFIDEIDWFNFSFHELVVLDLILNKKLKT